MDAVTVAYGLEIVEEGSYRDGIGLFKHGIFHGHTHLLSPLGYSARYSAMVLLSQLLQAIFIRPQRDGEVSAHRVEDFHSPCSLIVIVYFLIV